MQPHPPAWKQMVPEFVSCINSLAELLVWFDNNNLDDAFSSVARISPFQSPSFTHILSASPTHSLLPPSHLISTFIESNIHKTIIRIFTLAAPISDDIVIAILRFFNIFFESIKSFNVIFFMLSNNYINSLISIKLKLPLDDEILSYKITLLKNISNKLDIRTVQLLRDDSDMSFPLVAQAVTFAQHPEPMVRTAAKTIILNLLTIHDPLLSTYLVNHLTYFIHLSNHIAEITRKIFGLVGPDNHSDLLDQLDAFAESTEYMADIFALRHEPTSRALAAAFLKHVVIAPLAFGLTLGVQEKRVSLFLITRILYSGLGYRPLIDRIVDIVFVAPRNKLLVPSTRYSAALPYTPDTTPEKGDLTVHQPPLSEVLWSDLKPTQCDDTIRLILSLLRAVLAAGVSHDVLQAAHLLPARMFKTRRLLDALTSAPVEVDTGDHHQHESHGIASSANHRTLTSVDNPSVSTHAQAPAHEPSNTHSSSDHPATATPDDTTRLEDPRLVDRLLRILESEHMLNYTQLTQFLLCYLLVEFLGLGGTSLALPPKTDKLMDSVIDRWTTRFKTALDMDAANTMELFEREMQSVERYDTASSDRQEDQQLDETPRSSTVELALRASYVQPPAPPPPSLWMSPLNLEQAAIHVHNLSLPKDRPRYSPEADALVPLTVTIRTWLCLRECMVKLGRVRAISDPSSSPQPPSLFLTKTRSTWPALTSSACEYHMEPCVVHVTVQGKRIHPPSNWYFIYHDAYMVLCEADHLHLGALSTKKCIPWPRVRTRLAKDTPPNMLEIEEWNPVFIDTRSPTIQQTPRTRASTTLAPPSQPIIAALPSRMEGFDVLIDRTSPWSARLVFESTHIRDTIHAFMDKRRVEYIDEWKQSMIKYLNCFRSDRC